MAGNRRWSENDLKTLKAEYGRTDLEILSKKLNRSVDAIQWKASKAGISFVREVTVQEYNTITRQLDEINKKLDEVLKNYEHTK